MTAERLPCLEAMEPTGLTLGFLGKITNNFSEERVIGRGGYGKVYRGERDDGQEIAVKLLFNNMQTIDDVQFKREFENLMMLKHPNIVRLVGYCYETQHQHTELQGRIVFSEETHKALCFEYMPMGSLNNHLSDESSGLDWETRYRIIKGACEGLKYLHEDLQNPFYHLDLKPDNILLDENMVPKLADFGLSKFYGEEQTRMTHTCIGTLGYLPPEYLFRRVVSKKLDIFSLGVVMTKIIAGPIGPTRYDEMQLEFLDQVQGNWTKRLQASSPETLEAQCQQVKRCTEVALSCMDMDRHKRPSIVDIIHELDKTELSDEMATYYHEDPSPPLSRASGRRRLPPLASTSKVVQPKASPSPPSLPPSPTPSAIGSSAQLDGFLKIREGVYVLNSCFNPDALTGNKCQRQRYIKDIALSLKSNFVDARLLVYNFGVVYRSRSLVHDILAKYDITVTRYPSQYEGCAVPVLGMIHTFLSEMDDGLFREQVFVMHFEPGGWPVLAFLLAGLLLYQQKCTGEQKTLEMIYKQAPRELIQCLSPLNHMPSQIRYLQYISRSRISTIRGTPADPPLVLDYVVLRSIPNFYAKAGCCLIFRVYGMDPLFRIPTETKELFSTSKKYEQAEDGVIKIETNCNIEGDVVLECTCIYAEKEREEMMFRVMFNTSFIISDILMLGRDEIDMMWDAKDRFPDDFKAEVIFSKVTTKVQHTFSSTVCSDAEAEV